MWDSAGAPTMNRICHLDLTRAFLWPRAVAAGYTPEQLPNLRIGYDPAPVIVQADNSDLSIRLYTTGLLDAVSTLEACGYEEANKMDDAEQRAWLLEVLAHGRLATQPATTPGSEPVTPATVEMGPPQRPTSITSAAEPPPFEERTGGATAAERRLVERVVRLNQQLGTKLLADARHAYDDAMKRAGVNLTNRARNRAGVNRQQEVRQAVAGRAPLGPWCAAVGLREDELLRHAFDTFRERAAAEFAVYRERVTKLVEAAGVDVRLPTEADAAAAVDYLVAALTAAVRGRLIHGDAATLAAAAPSMVPRARRPAPTGGDVLPGLPDPDELSQAAARFTRNALRIHDRVATFTMPSTPDHPPFVATLDEVPFVERLTSTMNLAPTWVWRHGFYGEPHTVFEPHDALDGFTTTDREGDPDLYNSEPWPDADLYAPGDHDGCTCEWLVDVTEPVDEVAGRSGPVVQRHQSTADVLARARERVGAR
jgi:hypothetical protein